MPKIPTKLTAAACVLAGFGTAAMAELQAETQQPIKLAEFNIPDADFITNVYGEALKRAGYNVEYIKADYTAHFTALEFGDIHMSPAIWSSTPDLTEAALASPDVENLGSVGVDIREGWWYPDYVAELCPGLPDWKALLEDACVEALSSPEAPGKIRYISAPPDWSPYDEERVKSLGLPVEIVPPGTAAAMVATMDGAVKRGAPAIGFGFVPHWLYGAGNGQFVDFPTYDDACLTDASWGENPDEIGDCDLQAGTIYKLAYMPTAEWAPNAVEIFRRFTTTTEAVSQATDDIENGGMSAAEAAQKWMAGNEDLVQSWLK
ncbi:ABC transporter substrate-binding protein [Sagittula stellata]|uniref:ABC transporter binding protein n=1 Tax=Sagittula stellata (strain ATCC 700073 / DSM 11524 / E-37) TaxID=388399 RepID=A3K7Q6_SAGS3|nr:ABC transporter substrate-binding protein [Sagittula stellata]EBA06678.1 ABC transporter binding protein [Sagittula stellata E-37]